MAQLHPGSQTILYVSREATFGRPRQGVAGTTDIDTMNGTSYAFYTISDNLQGAEEREFRPDRSGDPDHTERYVGRKSATWEVTKLLLPAGTAGVSPDDRLLWEGLMGGASHSGTEVVFRFVTGGLRGDSFTIRRGIRVNQAAEDGDGGADFQDHVLGAAVTQGEITWGNQGNNGLAQVVFSGEAAQYGHTGNSNASGAVQTDKDLNSAGLLLRTSDGATGGAKAFSFGSLVAIKNDPGSVDDMSTGQGYTDASENISGANGLLLGTVNYTTDTIYSYYGGITGSAGAGVQIRPYNPTVSVVGTPVHARLGSLQLGQAGKPVNVKHLGGRVSIEENRSLLNEEVGDDAATRVIRNDRRNTTFAFDFIVKSTDVWLLGDVRNNQAQDVIVNIGNVGGSIVELHIPNAEFNFTPVDIPEQEISRVTLEGAALGGNSNMVGSMKVKFK